jgi:hypothetical protein
MESFAELFDNNFTTRRAEYEKQWPAEYTRFMTVEQTNRPFEKRTSISGLGLPIQNRDGAPLPYVEPVMGYPSTFIPVTYRLGYQIERQAVEDEQFGLLVNRPRTMLYGSVVIRDMVAADILNNGFTSQSYDLGGTPLFSTAQVREDGGAVWSNLINEDQPITAETVFNAIVTLLMLLQDSIGMNVGYTGKFVLHVPIINPELFQQAVEVINSVMNPGTSDNKINAALKQFTIELSPLRYLTNPDAWFVTWDPNSVGYGLILFERVAPEISPLAPFSGNPDVWWSRLRQRFTAGYEAKRGVAAVHAA